MSWHYQRPPSPTPRPKRPYLVTLVHPLTLGKISRANNDLEGISASSTSSVASPTYSFTDSFKEENIKGGASSPLQLSHIQKQIIQKNFIEHSSSKSLRSKLSTIDTKFHYQPFSSENILDITEHPSVPAKRAQPKPPTIIQEPDTKGKIVYLGKSRSSSSEPKPKQQQQQQPEGGAVILPSFSGHVPNGSDMVGLSPSSYYTSKYNNVSTMTELTTKPNNQKIAMKPAHGGIVNDSTFSQYSSTPSFQFTSLESFWPSRAFQSSFDGPKKVQQATPTHSQGSSPKLQSTSALDTTQSTFQKQDESHHWFARNLKSHPRRTWTYFQNIPKYNGHVPLTVNVPYIRKRFNPQIPDV
jgi:hypothetical protein